MAHNQGHQRHLGCVSDGCTGRHWSVKGTITTFHALTVLMKDTHACMHACTHTCTPMLQFLTHVVPFPVWFRVCSMLALAHWNNYWADYAGPGGWNGESKRKRKSFSKGPDRQIQVTVSGSLLKRVSSPVSAFSVSLSLSHSLPSSLSSCPSPSLGPPLSQFFSL